MPKPCPRTTYKYSDHFKATAVRLSHVPGVAFQDVADSLYIHPFMACGQLLMRGVMCHKAMLWKTTAAIFGAIVLCGCQGKFQASSAQLRSADAAYDSRELQLSLSKIEAWHRKNNTGLADSLREGIAVTTIELAFSEKDCQPNEELITLWSWRNGEDSYAPFVWYHDFLSVEEALSEYNWLRLNPLIRWDPKYIPLFTFEGEWYAVYCGPNGGKAGPIVHFSLEDGARVSYTNLTTFLASMAETLNSGAVTWTSEAMADDIGRIYRIHQKHNNNIMFPYYVPRGYQ